jgi:glycosyltransferase involved in cell wall biosynthesis
VHSPIYFDPRWTGNHGIGRFATELQQRLAGVVPLPIAGPKLSLLDPLASSLALSRCRDGCYLSPGFNPPLRSPIPFAFTIHDLIHLHVPTESTPLRRLYYATVVKPAARRAHCILTVSRYSQRMIVEWAGVPESQVVVVGNGVSAAFTPETSAASGGQYLLHVGRAASHKNVPRLLQAYARSRCREAFELVLAGERNRDTVGAVEALGLGSRVRFAGPTDDAGLAALYRGARALVFPSLYEGFGLPIIEAMACATPVITSRVTSMSEVAGEGNALLVDPLDVAELAAAMDRVCEDDTLREELAARGFQRARAFHWDAVAQRVEQALLPLLAGG